MQSTFPELLNAQARKHTDAVFISDVQEELTYAEADARTDRLARALVSLGVAPGDSVGLLVENSNAFVVAWFAVLKAGGVIAPVNTTLVGDGLAYSLAAIKARVLFCEAGLLDRFDAGAAGFETVITVGGDGEHTLDALLAADSAADLPAPSSDGGCQLMYSSGTTGRPKGVLRSTRSEVAKAALADRCGMNSDDVVIVPVPLFHGLGLNMVQMALWCGGRAVILPRFSASRFLAEAREHGATVMPHVGSIIATLLAQPERPDDADTPLRLSFGVGAPAADWERFERRFGLRFVEFYGSTETGLIFFNDPGGRVGSVGRVVDDVDARLVDLTGADADTGELLIRRHSDPPSYVDDVKETELRSENGWWRTGDLLRADADGYHFFLGRARDTIRRRGENIVPEDIERVVDTFPDVLESIAVAMPSPLGEDDVRLFVVPRPGASVDADELREWLTGRVPRYMVPTLVEPIDELPRTATHKVQRQVLRQRPLPIAEEAG